MLYRNKQLYLLTIILIQQYSYAMDYLRPIADISHVSSWITPWLDATIDEDSRPLIPYELIYNVFEQYLHIKKNTSDIIDSDAWYNNEQPPSIQAYFDSYINTKPTYCCFSSPNKAYQYHSYKSVYTHMKHTGQQQYIDCKNPYLEQYKLPSNSHIIFVGDLHGSMCSFAQLLKQLLQQNIINEDWQITSPHYYFCFLGDIVDRGSYGLACWNTIMQLFINNPDNVFIARGNHEEYSSWGIFFPQSYQRFGDELQYNYPSNYEKIMLMFMTFTELLPHGIVVTSGYNPLLQKPTRILCCHGGIEPSIKLTNFYASRKKFLFLKNSFEGFNWSDFTGKCFSKKTATIEFFNYRWHQNEHRRRGYMATLPDTYYYLACNELSMIFRGHQDQDSWFKLLRRDYRYPMDWYQCLAYRHILYPNDTTYAEKIDLLPDIFPNYTKTTCITYTFKPALLRTCKTKKPFIIESTEDLSDFFIPPFTSSSSTKNPLLSNNKKPTRTQQEVQGYLTAPVCTMSLAGDKQADRNIAKIGALIAVTQEFFEDWEIKVYEYPLQ